MSLARPLSYPVLRQQALDTHSWARNVRSVRPMIAVKSAAHSWIYRNLLPRAAWSLHKQRNKCAYLLPVDWALLAPI